MLYSGNGRCTYKRRCLHYMFLFFHLIKHSELLYWSFSCTLIVLEFKMVLSKAMFVEVFVMTIFVLLESLRERIWRYPINRIDHRTTIISMYICNQTTYVVWNVLVYCNRFIPRLTILWTCFWIESFYVFYCMARSGWSLLVYFFLISCILSARNVLTSIR